MIKDGAAQTDFELGAGSLVTRPSWDRPTTFRVAIRTTGDGHTFPNLNFMRSDIDAGDDRDWSWRGYRLYFSLCDRDVRFDRVEPGSHGVLWRSANAWGYDIGEWYVVEVRFTDDNFIGGLITRRSDGELMDSFKIQDGRYRTGHFALRGEAHSGSVAFWDDVSIALGTP